MSKNDYITVKIQATLFIPKDFIDDDCYELLASELTNESLKVKSGVYENIAVGDIDNVISIED